MGKYGVIFMSTRLPEELKKRLTAEGRYGEFRLRQADLKASGMKPVEVRRALMAEFGGACGGVGAAAGGENAGTVAVEDGGVGCLKGRRCSDGEAFRWALIHSQLGDGRVEEAPGELAWAIFLLFRDSPAAKVAISQTILSKLVAKDDGGGAGDGKMDGQAEYDILANLGEGLK